MNNPLAILHRLAVIAVIMALSACASLTGPPLTPGVSTLAEVIAAMGKPAMNWRDPDGREQLAYPQGPYGTQTYMAFISADGRLERLETVLDYPHFARIVIDKSTQEDVLRLIGPPYAPWTTYYEGFNQIAWEWNYCDAWREVARFNVYFDAATGIVRRTEQRVYRGDMPPLFGRRARSSFSC